MDTTLKEKIEKLITDEGYEGKLAEKLRKLALSKKQITKNQHWVPQGYLKKFTNKQNELCVMKTENKQIMKSRPTKSVCSDDFFYGAWTGTEDEWSQIIEVILKEHEDEFLEISKDLEKIISKKGKISKEILIKLSWHIAYLHVRTPYSRNKAIGWERQSLNMEAKLTAGHKGAWASEVKRLQSLNPNITDKEIEEHRKYLFNFKEQKVNHSNTSHMHYMAMAESLMQCLAIKKWCIYVIPENTDLRFVTSDTPVIELIPPEWEKGFHSPGVPDLVHYFPLSPKILIELTAPDKDNHEILKPNFKVITSPINVHKFNLYRIMDHAQSKFVYSSQNSDFTLPIEIIKEARNQLIESAIQRTLRF